MENNRHDQMNYGQVTLIAKDSVCCIILVKEQY